MPVIGLPGIAVGTAAGRVGRVGALRIGDCVVAADVVARAGDLAGTDAPDDAVDAVLLEDVLALAPASAGDGVVAGAVAPCWEERGCAGAAWDAGGVVRRGDSGGIEKLTLGIGA
ncbi:MAG: hypothetical protein LBM04_01850 [Opitutaceae bacterium]|nr:hypothetical protein [Opitutaceae bacterium]